MLFCNLQSYWGKGIFPFLSKTIGGVQFWCYLWISVFCKFSVSLFFMISGALLIPRENESLGFLYKNRVLKIVCTLFAFSALYFVREIQLGTQTWNIGDFFLRVYEGNLTTPYWYLYAYIAFLITLPIIRALAKSLEDKYYYYIFFLWIIFVAISILQYLFGKSQHVLNANINVGWVTTSTVFCPIMGYFMQHRVKDLEKKGKTILFMWIINLLAICVSCYMTYLRAVDMGECNEGVSQVFHGSFAALNAMTIFLTIKYIYLRYGEIFPSWLNKIVASVGSATFGIYLLHGLVLGKWRNFQKLWDVFLIKWHLNHMLSAFLICLCVMTICYIATIIMKKIPLLRKLI